METTLRLMVQSARDMRRIADNSVDLVVTSPPYPMIEMWDETFSTQDPRIEPELSTGNGQQAFRYMHELLDDVWSEVVRVLRIGGLACINVGDATRSLNGDFRLYSNHSRILWSLSDLGMTILPDILWRKQTNAPNKFMGSGMLPVGAYVTYEHEYILIARKGRRREFKSEDDKRKRAESAFFWEERNLWFSDVWFDVKGTAQELTDSRIRRRSAAFPFEIAHRLICMFSIKEDTVLDPFLGTGTTLAAAAVTGRNAIGIDIDPELTYSAADMLSGVSRFANDFNASRILRHVEFAAERYSQNRPMKYVNQHYDFPVVTAQERKALLNTLPGIESTGDMEFRVEYGDAPDPALCGVWKTALRDRSDGEVRLEDEAGRTSRGRRKAQKNRSQRQLSL